MRLSGNESYASQSRFRLNPDFVICLLKPYIISIINAILEEKKATRWEGGFTNKTV